MKPWEQAFKYIGIIAVVLVVVFGIQQSVKTTQYQKNLADFKAVTKQIKASSAGAKLTAQQRSMIGLAAQKAERSRPLLQIGKSSSLACDPGTGGCGTVSLCQDLATQIWSYWDAGGVDALTGQSSYDRAAMLWNAFMEICY